VLPSLRLKVTGSGVIWKGRTYQSRLLRDYVRPNPNDTQGKWVFRYHTGDMSRLLFRDENGTWHSIPWIGLTTTPLPFTEHAWSAAKALAKKESKSPRESEVAKKLSELLQSAEEGPSKNRKARGVAERSAQAGKDLSELLAPKDDQDRDTAEDEPDEHAGLDFSMDRLDERDEQSSLTKDHPNDSNGSKP